MTEAGASAPAACSGAWPVRPLVAHEGDEPHFHEWSEEAKSALAEVIWKAENVELTTVGIDIGSSTSHLMFSRVHLQRKTQALSSEFVVVRREIVWRSPILLTPFVSDDTIDAERLRAFIDSAYEGAGLARAEVDTGAVILTGEAIKRKNAQAIAQIFAADAGRFVCASAGHRLECVLAAHGAGAVAMSKQTHRTVLHVDIGGGTTKFALIRNGEIRETCATAVGGRLIAWDGEGLLTRIEGPALRAAAAAGVELRLGARPDPIALERLTDVLAEVVISMLRGEAPQGLARDLLLTDPLSRGAAPHAITFSGGVSEYLFARERETFGDIAKPLADRLALAFARGRIDAPMKDPGQGLRATVIGASQFSVQLSGNTIHLSEGVSLPLRNVPVLFPDVALDAHFDAESVAAAIRAALEQRGAAPEEPIALGIRWHGDPHYARLREIAAGVAQAVGSAPGPLVLMVDGDVGKLLGHLLEHELGVKRDVISVDGIRLHEFDYVDIGERMQPTQAVPLVIKTLLFPTH